MTSDLSHLPPYARIAAEIKRRIERHEWKLGEALPPQRQLSVSYGVTTATLNRAIGMLIDEGVLTTSSGHGTFVASVPSAPAETSVRAHPPGQKNAGVAPGMEIALIAPSDHDPLADSLGSDPITDVVAHAVERVVSAAQGHLSFYRLWHGGLSSVDDAFASACRAGADAIIVMNILDYAGVDAASEPHLTSQRIPGILIPGGANLYAIPQVSYSQEQAGFTAGDHLLAMGYRHIVAIRAVDAVWCDQRITGVAAALRARSLAGQAALEIVDAALPLTESHGVSDKALGEAADGYLELMCKASWWGRQPTGVAMPSDRYALALLGAMRRRGIVPGRQVGVLGFNDSGPARMAGLTSVRPPLEALGAWAAEAVLRSAGQPLMVTQTILPSTVTARDSTRMG